MAMAWQYQGESVPVHVWYRGTVCAQVITSTLIHSEVIEILVCGSEELVQLAIGFGDILHDSLCTRDAYFRLLIGLQTISCQIDSRPRSREPGPRIMGRDEGQSAFCLRAIERLTYDQAIQFALLILRQFERTPGLLLSPFPSLLSLLRFSRLRLKVWISVAISSHLRQGSI